MSQKKTECLETGKSFKRRSTTEKRHEFETVRPDQKVLTPDEKIFLLNVERGDLPCVKRLVIAFAKNKQMFDINCMDPIGRSGLMIAIENENLEMIQYLLEEGIQPKDALLVAIREDYVDGVETLLKFEEENHQPDTPYSWQSTDQVTANFTADMTPVILAAQKNNYEILKMLLDRGASIPMPHDIKCSCFDCVESSADDSLQFSLSRINAYKALSSPSLIALSSKDPILTAFELSSELKSLSVLESQFRSEYCKLRTIVQGLATGLIDHARTSYELEVLLNHNPEGEPWNPGETQTLERLKLAIKYNQKEFVAHPSVQQLLAAIWYEALPGFKRLHFILQIQTLFKHSLMFPFYSLIYMFFPKSPTGHLIKSPFVKFIIHSASYMVFLLLLAMASQRIEYIILDILVVLIPNSDWLLDMKADWIKHERGSFPSLVELLVICYVQGFVWQQIKSIHTNGLLEYMMDLWNLADAFSYGSFMGWIGLRAISFIMVQKELMNGVSPEEIWKPRDEWHSFEPMLLAEAMYGAGMISSFLKLVQIFSINPYLGPLQVSLGKMIIDIAKWLVIYILVLFSFGCGLNQLLWYYADLEKNKCYSLPENLPNFENERDACITWRRFANLWETSQSLFWASFGLVELGDFELTGIKEFTRFWGLLMFGSYSVCNIIVLLNMLIAMMSNSYTAIAERSDVEWKFARSRLWMSYFDEGSTLPPPFNLIPTLKSLSKAVSCSRNDNSKASDKVKKEALQRYYGVIRCLVRRYITDEQRKSQDFNITEDDINEVRQDVRSFRYELINIFKMNNMKTPNVQENNVIGRKSKDMERMIHKDFSIAKVEGLVNNIFAKNKSDKQKDLFKRLAKVITKKPKQDCNEEVRDKEDVNPIGSTANSIRRQRASFKRSMMKRGTSQEDLVHNLKALNPDELITYNPLLKDVTPTTRIAYARFKSNLHEILPDIPETESNLTKKDSKKTIKEYLKPVKSILKKTEVVSPGTNEEKANEEQLKTQEKQENEKELKTTETQNNDEKPKTQTGDVRTESQEKEKKSQEEEKKKNKSDNEDKKRTTQEETDVLHDILMDDDEIEDDESPSSGEAKFNSNGKSVLTGKNIRGWI